MSSKSGFTLIEVLIAITLLTLLVTTPMSVIANYLIQNKQTKEYITAKLYAEELLEYARHIRDSNFLNADDLYWLGDSEDRTSLKYCLRVNAMGVEDKKICYARGKSHPNMPILDTESVSSFSAGMVADLMPTKSKTCDNKNTTEDGYKIGKKYIRTLYLEGDVDPPGIQPNTPVPPRTVKLIVCISWVERDQTGSPKYRTLTKETILYRWIIR